MPTIDMYPNTVSITRYPLEGEDRTKGLPVVVGSNVACNIQVISGATSGANRKVQQGMEQTEINHVAFFENNPGIQERDELTDVDNDFVYVAQGPSFDEVGHGAYYTATLKVKK